MAEHARYEARMMENQPDFIARRGATQPARAQTTQDDANWIIMAEQIVAGTYHFITRVNTTNVWRVKLM